MERLCVRCKKTLPITNFRDGRTTCKKCGSEQAAAWNRAHPDRVKAKLAKCREKNRANILARASQYNKAHRATLTEYMRNWREANRERVNSIAKGCRERNKERVAHLKAERAARKRCKMTLLPEVKKAVREIYLKARNLSKSTGISHHVDHIIPLTHERVCGLHVPANLRIIHWRDNLAKGNRFIEALG